MKNTEYRGIVARIGYCVVNGTTLTYLTLKQRADADSNEDGPFRFERSLVEDENAGLALTQSGDSVTFQLLPADNETPPNSACKFNNSTLLHNKHRYFPQRW